MPNELLLQASRLAADATVADCNQNLRYVPPMPSATPPLASGAYDCLVVRRPMRLPLRKHHTFHFQTTQTANGKLQQLRRQLQQQQQEREQQQQQWQHQELGPLIYRPLALSERHAFKPISPTPATTTTTLPDYEKRKENETQQQQLNQEQQQKPMMVQLNPAASLEALEVLTKTHPDFMFTRPKKEQSEQNVGAAVAATVANEAEEEEDLGYSFCEEEYMVDDDNDNDNDVDVDVDVDVEVDEDDDDEEEVLSSHNLTAPPTTPAHSSNNSNNNGSSNNAAIANATAGALRYFMTQSYREVHI